MSDLVEIFERFGKLFSIELSVCIKPDVGHKALSCNGWARVTFITYDGAQKALFAHLTRRIPGTLSPLSIYKGAVSNVILLKNIPASEPKAKVIDLLNEYPGVVSIAFTNQTTARMTFEDLDLALLFMDIVSKGELIIEGFTCSVDIDPEEDEDENDMFFTPEVQSY
ncbi:unnamed protein product [Allacma fusca]|uniref:RRM domain-containing protein n=1 Tax=Allacma fusca TaxID=39272 RepID=A0A8J2J4I0_9HEXA|nr:unnamed protein product [Allacma fusca]